MVELMPHSHENKIECADEKCLLEINSSKFDKIRAAELGWFFSRKDNKAYCPKHIPAWVSEWRSKKT